MITVVEFCMVSLVALGAYFIFIKRKEESRDNTTADTNKLREPFRERTQPVKGHAPTREMGMPSDSKIVPIVDLTPQGSGTGMKRLSHFHQDNLAAVLKSVEEYPTIVVSVTGLFRSGKSFLINLMITFLEHLQKNGTSEGWVNSNVPIHGVNWAQQKDTVTKGILMWKEPFVLQRSNGKKVAVVLIDCQGTGDVRLSSTKLDTLIFYISLQLSMIQIINLKTQMSANDLNTLVMCTAYADAAADPDEEEDTLFNRLIYVQRNWESDKVYGERPESEFKDLIGGSDTSAEIKTAGEGILKAFRKVSTYAIPHPGSKLAESSEGDTIRVSGDDIQSAFLNAVCALFENMFCKPGMDKEATKGKTIIEDFKNLERRVAENDLETNSPTDSLDDSRAYKAYKTVSAALEEKYKSLLKEASQGDTQQVVLDRKLDAIYQSIVLEGYDKAYRKKPGSDKTKGYSKHFAELEGKFRDQKENIIEQAKKAAAVKNAAIEKTKLKAEMQKKEEQNKAQMQRIEKERIAERQKTERQRIENAKRIAELEEKERRGTNKLVKVLQGVGTGASALLGGLLGGPAGAAIGMTAFKKGTDEIIDDD